jgi:hypothetical protein
MHFFTEVKYLYELVSSRAVLSALYSLLNAALLMRPSQLLNNSQAALTLLPLFKNEKNRKEAIATYTSALRTIKKDVTQNFLRVKVYTGLYCIK